MILLDSDYPGEKTLCRNHKFFKYNPDGSDTFAMALQRSLGGKKFLLSRMNAIQGIHGIHYMCGI